jgi:hypothetical protein
MTMFIRREPSAVGSSDPSIATLGGAEGRREGSARRRFLALSVVFLVAACSAMKLGYNNADTLVAHGLDNYFDLDDEQAELVRNRMRELLRWHRRTQLAAYSELLQRAHARVGGNVTAVDVLALQTEIHGMLATMGERAAPDIAHVSARLNQGQIDKFARKLTEDTRKAQRELVSYAGPHGIDRRGKRYLERAEEWLGPLTREQQELVRTSLAEHADERQWWMTERERRQREAVALLRRIEVERPDEATATRWWRNYFAELAEPRDAERRARVLRTREHNAELIAKLVNSATPTQRATVARKLRGYADDFMTLAAEVPGRPS